MSAKKILAGVLALSLVIPALYQGGIRESEAAGTTEITLERDAYSNPISGTDDKGNRIYGGDPAVLVDGDTVYLYTGHDTSKNDVYVIPEWVCYSSKDMKNWKYESVVMKADSKTITWANTETSAWAGQVAKHYDKEAGKDRYYFYFCTWDKTANGDQSIGVAVSDSPTGPFVDKGEPLVKGTVTTDKSSGWNDIDPTVWVETDEKGEEHRYLAWGNNKLYICEMNEDMVSVKDMNGDGKITFGNDFKTADIVNRQKGIASLTEAPWLYRRQNTDGSYYGPYYLFYAYGFREQMAYVTTDNLLTGQWKNGGILMPATASSDTNHMAVFDFKGKTYFVYHNGMLPGGSGQRRTACVAEMKFNKDGSIQPIPETVTGLSGTTTKIYCNSGETSTWNDIDPTAWIETDENGTEHRYLAWGNGKYFVCELNEDMVSVKDINGDGKITFGTQASGKTSKDVDIIEKDMTGLSFTEAPWIYRRQDANGKYYGKYYLFYAHSWREQMAYTTTDDLLDGKWDDSGNVVMEPSVTSNTNHMAVFDFKGKTYFVYHNGSMPAGSGFRRIPCITEIKFEENGSILAIPETASGINGKTSQIYVSGGLALAHEHFINSGADGEYPYTKVDVGLYLNPQEADAQWVITAGKADRSNKEYVSIQSENKPGLYLTANEDKTVTLAQDYDLRAIPETAKKQTFIQKAGLADASMVSFESVSQPGMYITLVGRTIALTDGSDKAAATFSIDKKPAASSDAKTENSFTSLKVDGKDVDVAEKEHNLEVDLSKEEILVEPVLADKDGYYTLEQIAADGTVLNVPKILVGSADLSSEVSLEGEETRIRLTAYAENLSAVQTIVIAIKTKDASDFSLGENLVKSFGFEDKTDDATAVTKAAKPVPVANPEYKYAEGKFGKGIVLDGTYGLKLADSKDLNLGESYTISFWMKPDVLGGAVDPTLAAGTFSPEHWLNLTFDAKIWSRSGDYIATTAANTYKAGEWQHVAVCVNGDKEGTLKNTCRARLYINGELVSSGDIAKGIMTTENSAIYFGVNAWDAYFKGTLDDVMIINRYLAQKEVQVIAKGTVTAK